MEETNSTLGVPHQISEKSLDNKALNLFSRQNAALGAETTAKLTKMRVLIYGVRGVGVETCKNLALQGAGSITVSIIPCSFYLSRIFIIIRFLDCRFVFN